MIKRHQPFQLAYGLAESLCSYAKHSARQHENNNENIIPSACAMHRITSSYISDYNTARQQELTVVDGSSTQLLTMGAYGLGNHASGLPPLDALLHIRNLFTQTKQESNEVESVDDQNTAVTETDDNRELILGPLRHFLTLLHSKPAEAASSYERWQKAAKEHSSFNFTDFTEQVKRIYGDSYNDKHMPFLHNPEGSQCTLIGDLVHLVEAKGVSNDLNNTDKDDGAPNDER